MQIIRYVSPLSPGPRVGLLDGDGPVRPLPVGSVAELLRLSRAELEARLDEWLGEWSRAGGPAPDPGPIRLLPPVDGLTEVWASGVTYRRSSEARQEESSVADVYSMVYDARRPELFFKSPAWRVVGTGEPIGVREDSAVDVPEPELALVINAHGEIVGLSICDDVSSRSIEGENPLYLPQAKIYSGACALGPGITPLRAVADPSDLDVEVAVLREGSAVWSGTTSTGRLHRTFDDLVGYLHRAATFPDGVLLSTGTGLVPELTFTLKVGDRVDVTVEGLGTLSNPVHPAEDFAWLTPAPDRRAPGTDPALRTDPALPVDQALRIDPASGGTA
jgi:2-dehydro-3-deoxy-D-arabinonate dehydratase